MNFAANEEVSMKLNTEEKLDKIKKLVENWGLRKLSIFGKISVIKALLASQLVYILTPLRTCPKTLKEVNALLFKFLWDDKGDRIKRSVIINKYENGVEVQECWISFLSIERSKLSGLQNISTALIKAIGKIFLITTSINWAEKPLFYIT